MITATDVSSVVTAHDEVLVSGPTMGSADLAAVAVRARGLLGADGDRVGQRHVFDGIRGVVHNVDSGSAPLIRSLPEMAINRVRDLACRGDRRGHARPGP